MSRKWIAASLAIVSMWVAVLFTGLFAPTLKVVDNAGNSVELPLAGIVVALFAFIATIVVAAVGFRGGPEARSGSGPDALPRGISNPGSGRMEAAGSTSAKNPGGMPRPQPSATEMLPTRTATRQARTPFADDRLGRHSTEA